LDGSGSIGHYNFEIVKNWTKAVALNINISKEFAQLGMIQYSHHFAKKYVCIFFSRDNRSKNLLFCNVFSKQQEKVINKDEAKVFILS